MFIRIVGSAASTLLLSTRLFTLKASPKSKIHDNSDDIVITTAYIFRVTRTHMQSIMTTGECLLSAALDSYTVMSA